MQLRASNTLSGNIPVTQPGTGRREYRDLDATLSGDLLTLTPLLSTYAGAGCPSPRCEPFPAPAPLPLPMYDLIRCTATVPPSRVLDNHRLKCYDDSSVNRTTGEELTRRGTIGDLKFTYSISDERLRLEGSLNKYHAGGRNDGAFTLPDVRAAVNRLSEVLQIPADELELKSLEFGVNVTPPPVPAGSTGILERLHLLTFNSLRPFTPMAGLHGHQGKDTRTRNAKYHVKMYDKAAQNRLRRPLLRYELHGQVRHLRERLGLPIASLADLAKLSIWQSCSELLLQTAETLVYHEPLSPDGCSPGDMLFIRTRRTLGILARDYRGYPLPPSCSLPRPDGSTS